MRSALLEKVRLNSYEPTRSELMIDEIRVADLEIPYRVVKQESLGICK